MTRSVSKAADIVKEVFAQLEKGKGLVREEIEAGWKKAAGESAFKHSRPMSLRKKILAVYVDSSVWLEELTIKKRFILKALKKQLGRDKISEIRFKVGEF